MSNEKTKMQAGRLLAVILMPLASAYFLSVFHELIGVDVMPVASMIEK
ncbi:hypothetical protein [Citrobacter freundii]|nr:hypothetical protein [Citrobacter freundii]